MKNLYLKRKRGSEASEAMRKVYPYCDDDRNGRPRYVCPVGKYCKDKYCRDAHPNLRGKVEDIKYSTYCKYGSMKSCVRIMCLFSHSFYSREEINSRKRQREETDSRKQIEQGKEKQEKLKEEQKEQGEEEKQKEEQTLVGEPPEEQEERERLFGIYSRLCDEYCDYIKNIPCSSATEPGEIAQIDIVKLRENYCILRESYNNLIKSFSLI